MARPDKGVGQLPSTKILGILQKQRFQNYGFFFYQISLNSEKHAPGYIKKKQQQLHKHSGGRPN